MMSLDNEQQAVIAQLRAALQIERNENARLRSIENKWRQRYAELEKERDKALEMIKRPMLTIRCVQHRNVPQYNKESAGSECAACEVEELRAVLERYADKDNWTSLEGEPLHHFVWLWAGNGYDLARAALALEGKL